MSCVFLPHELITEVLSFLPVRSLMRLICVSKSWKTLISNPIFVKLHLKRSARNNHLAVLSNGYMKSSNYFSVSLIRLPEDTSVTISDIDKCYLKLKKGGYIYPIGCYNGLLCLLGNFYDDEVSFYLWNPATRTLSNKILFAYGEYDDYYLLDLNILCGWKFAFGYDHSTETYKIVAFCLRSNDVIVFGFGDKVWKIIQSFPVVPFEHDSCTNHCVYLSDSFNWLAVRKESQYNHDSKFNTIDQFVIISLDLSTETYRQLLPPRSFDKVPLVQTSLAVLMDSLCFCHDFSGTDFIIWKMKEFGVQESWIKFLKISYQSLDPIDISPLVLFPLSLSENGRTLILTCNRDQSKVIRYNLRDNIEEKNGITDTRSWYYSKDYVESLVSIC